MYRFDAQIHSRSYGRSHLYLHELDMCRVAMITGVVLREDLTGSERRKVGVTYRKAGHFVPRLVHVHGLTILSREVLFVYCKDFFIGSAPVAACSYGNCRPCAPVNSYRG